MCWRKSLLYSCCNEPWQWFLWTVEEFRDFSFCRFNVKHCFSLVMLHKYNSLVCRVISKVMDEADRILNMDFEVEVDKILKVIPRERRTFLFSATMTKKVQKLQRASLKDPVKVEVSTKYQTVEKLQQYYIFIPLKFKVWVCDDDVHCCWLM